MVRDSNWIGICMYYKRMLLVDWPFLVVSLGFLLLHNFVYILIQFCTDAGPITLPDPPYRHTAIEPGPAAPNGRAQRPLHQCTGEAFTMHQPDVNGAWDVLLKMEYWWWWWTSTYSHGQWSNSPMLSLPLGLVLSLHLKSSNQLRV